MLTLDYRKYYEQPTTVFNAVSRIGLSSTVFSWLIITQKRNIATCN